MTGTNDKQYSLINATAEPVSLASLCSIKYVVVKTLIEKQTIGLPSLGDLPPGLKPLG